MSDVPFVDTDKEITESVEDTARNLLPWLPDPYQCDECGTYCIAESAYSPEVVDVVDAWVCPNEACGKWYYRERV